MFDRTQKGIEVSRQALYAEAWSMPMTKLSKEYGISDVALAKICRKLDVPYPWRGYWREKETGKTPTIPPLPKNEDPTKQKIIICRSMLSGPSLSDEAVQRIAEERIPERKIEVPHRLGKPHRLLSGHLTNWRSAPIDEYGAIKDGSIRQLNIRVSRLSLPRALRILNTLFFALESRGYKVAVTEGFNKKTLRASIDGEPVEFGIEERFQRIELPRDKKQQQTPWAYSRQYRYLATGNLTLKINEWIEGLTKSWSDGNTAQLEISLNDFIVGLLKAAEALKSRRMKREEEDRLRLEKLKQQKEEEQRRQEEANRRHSLIKEAESWSQAQQVRTYLEAVKHAVIAKHGTIREGSETAQWLTWAYQQADCLDPLRP